MPGKENFPDEGIKCHRLFFEDPFANLIIKGARHGAGGGRGALGAGGGKGYLKPA